MIISLTFTSLIGFPIITPVLSAVRDALNISIENVGSIVAAYPATRIVFIPLVGLIVDS